MRGIIEYGSLIHSRPLSLPYLSSQSTFDRVQEAPIDGVAFEIENDSSTRISRLLYSTTEYGMDDCTQMLSVIKDRYKIGWGRVRYNWAIIQFLNNTIDWFSSDIQIVINNFSFVAEFVKEAGLYGIFFDPQPYGSNQWKYSAMPQKTSHTFEQYEAQVYKCARRIAENWRRQKSDIQIFFIKSYVLYYDEIVSSGQADAVYGFYKAFLDGIYDEFGENQAITISDPSRPLSYGKNSGARIVISNNESFACKTSPCAVDKYARITGSIDSRYKGGTVYFDELSQFSLGAWAEYVVAPSVFNNSDPTVNYHTATEWRTSLGYLADQSIEWLWLFTNDYNLFNHDPLFSVLNSLYVTALRNFRVDKGLT
jgi:hypothetical protein